MKKEFHLTQSGYDELHDEMHALLERRVEIAEKLKIAREHGDLSENAEYHNAREEQAQTEARITEIEHILKNSEIIKSPKNVSLVELGNTVTLKGLKGTAEYTIVGSVEANPALKKISDASPIGQALLGKKVGDNVDIVLPTGTNSFTVKGIK